ncbi:MAG: AI-2E family transporter [Eubacterium sp.]|nr:AI-2E family transporter [Eubacterium sp.]
MKKLDPKFNGYFYLGLTLFLVILASLLVAAVYLSWDRIETGFAMVNNALVPVYVGLIIAYLLAPLVNKADQYLFVPLFHKIMKKEDKIKKLARGCSVFLTMVVSILFVFALFMMIIPEVIDSVSGLVSNMPTYYNNVSSELQKLFDSNPGYQHYFTDMLDNIYVSLMDWLKNDFLPTSNEMLSNLTDGLVSAVGYVVNIFIGLIVAIYLLAAKERFCAMGKKILCAFVPDKGVEKIMELLRDTHMIFAKFISGKLIDSLLVGVLTFIIMSIAGVPYTLLISVLIGVTNVIPFFGQYIGIIPSAIIVFIANPVKGVIFLVLIIILMQVDGNIIGPKILGESIGLGSFWILFSILFFGSLFGLLGMICGVPLFAVIYRYVKRWVEKRLKKKERPVPTEAYIKEVVKMPEQKDQAKEEE